MISKKEIKKFLQEEIETMDQRAKEANYLYCDNYDSFNIDDCDGAYYEDAYGTLSDLIEQRNEDYAELAEEYAELEDFYLDQPSLIEPVKTELQKAAELRKKREYTKTITICDDLLQKNPNNRYAIDLKIAALGDCGSQEAYDLAVLYMEKYADKKDFRNTMYGLLQKMKCREDDFVKCLYKYSSELLDAYVKLLNENSPKRRYLKTVMREARE
ncbi:MAG: hypothetical protein IJ564_06625 [Alphaproteobacteria bacterium]|nr:hypothetical protein [Alphaproteobacteria bacterium]